MLGFGLGVVSAAVRGLGSILPPVGPVPIYASADLNAAKAFQATVLSYATAADLFAGLNTIRDTVLQAGVPVGQALTDATTLPQWNSTSKTLRPAATGPFDLNGVRVPGTIYVGPERTDPVTVRNSLVTAPDGGGQTYNVQKLNGASAPLLVERSTLERAVSAANSGGAGATYRQVVSQLHNGDIFKGGDGPQRFESCYGYAGGQGAGAHFDGFQSSSGADAVVVRTFVFGAPPGATYSTDSYGPTNAIRIDASNGSRVCERMRFYGYFMGVGGLYPIGIDAQKTDSVVRNITVAHCIGPAPEFRDPAAGADTMIHPSFTVEPEGGLVENVVFFGNKVHTRGALLYNGADATGIWHYNPATLDAATKADLIDLDLFTSAGAPVAGAIRSVAATINTTTRTVAATGTVALSLDLSAIPADAVITVHVPGGTGHPTYEYDGAV